MAGGGVELMVRDHPAISEDAHETDGTPAHISAPSTGNASSPVSHTNPPASAWGDASDQRGERSPPGSNPEDTSQGEDDATESLPRPDCDRDSTADDATLLRFSLVSQADDAQSDASEDSGVDVDIRAKARLLLSRSETCRRQTDSVRTEIESYVVKKRRAAESEVRRRPVTAAITPTRGSRQRPSTARKSLLPDLDPHKVYAREETQGSSAVSRPSTSRAAGQHAIQQMEKREEERRQRREAVRRQESERATAEASARKEEARRAKQAMLDAQRAQRVETSRRQTEMRKKAEERDNRRLQRESSRKAELEAVVEQSRRSGRTGMTSRGGNRDSEGSASSRRPRTGKLAELSQTRQPATPAPTDQEMQEQEEAVERQRLADEVMIEEYAARALAETRDVAQKKLDKSVKSRP